MIELNRSENMAIIVFEDSNGNPINVGSFLILTFVFRLISLNAQNAIPKLTPSA